LKDAYDPSSTFESLYHAHKEFVDAFDGEIMDHKDVQKTFPHLFDATGPKRERARSKPRKGRGPPRKPLRRSDYIKMIIILALAMSAMYFGHRSEQQLRGGVQRQHRPTDPLKKLLYDMEQTSCDDLSSTYRKAALETHPDKGGSNDAFRELHEKYKAEQKSCRRDPEARKIRNNRRNPDENTRHKHRRQRARQKHNNRRKPPKHARRSRRYKHERRMEEESTLRF